MKYSLYYINENNQKEYLISSKHKPVLINAILDCATDEADGDFYRFELVFSPFSQTYLLLDIGYKATDVIAEWSSMDNILDELIEIMQKSYDLKFVAEEVLIDESIAIQ